MRDRLSLRKDAWASISQACIAKSNHFIHSKCQVVVRKKTLNVSWADLITSKTQSINTFWLDSISTYTASLEVIEAWHKTPTLFISHWRPSTRVTEYFKHCHDEEKRGREISESKNSIQSPFLSFALQQLYLIFNFATLKSLKTCPQGEFLISKIL